jgi:hypothetical protein
VQDSRAAGAGLRAQSGAARSAGRDLVHHPGPEAGTAVALGDPERQRPAADPADFLHQGHLGDRVLAFPAVALADAGDDLDDAASAFLEGAGDARELFGPGEGARQLPSVFDRVHEAARGREAERAGVHGLADQRGHLRYIRFVGRGVAEAALPMT